MLGDEGVVLDVCATSLASNISNISACFGGAGLSPDLTAGNILDSPWALTCILLKAFSLLIVFPWLAAGGLAISVWVTKTIPNFIFNRQGLRPTKLPSSTWVIHGKKYDLSAWVDDHPGGRHALDLGRNRDCTGLFESYHVFVDKTKLQKILARFEIRSEEAAKDSLDNIQAQVGTNQTGLEFADAFHEDVKQMVRDHFQGSSHKMKPWVAALNLGLVLTEIVLIYLFLQGSNIAMVLLPTCGWLLTCNVAHDGSHFAVSSRPWVNEVAAMAGMPMCFPRLCWEIQHVVQHHIYTNDEDDVDLYHFLPVCRTARFTKWATQFRLQWLAIFFVLPTTVGHLMFVVPIDLLSGQLDAISGLKRYSHCQNLADLVARSRKSIAFELALVSIFPMLSIYMFGFVDGFRRVFTAYGIASYWFIFITQGAHIQEACMVGKEGQYTSWAKRQAATSVNFRPDSYFWLLLTGGLNLQSLHHVVPVIGSSHLIDLYPKYKEVCARHGVELKEVRGIFEFFTGFIAWVRELAQKEEEEPAEASKEIGAPLVQDQCSVVMDK